MTYNEEYKRFRLEYWKRMVEEHQGNVISMAKASGVNRTAVHKMVVKLGLKRVERSSSDKKFIGGKGKTRIYVTQFRLPMDYPLLCEP
jgi:hypothetical protein